MIETLKTVGRRLQIGGPNDAAPWARLKSTGFTRLFIGFIAIAMTSYHVYIAYAGIPEPLLLRSIHLGFAMVLGFALFRARRPGSAEEVEGGDGPPRAQTIPWYDWIFIALSVAIAAHITLDYQRIVFRFPYVDPMTTTDVVLSITLVFLILELTRRILGWGLVIIALIFIIHSVLGNQLPGFLYHPGVDMTQFVDHIYLTTTGIYGTIVGLSATFIFLFILFGVFLQKVGASRFFMNIAISVTKKERGGPAKAATIASAFFGMMSGSTVANVYTTGAITIPLMIRTGIKKRFAAGVEAVASASGQIMPPVMGATAFLIAEFTGRRYIDVAIAGIAPAFLYLFAIYWMIHFQANRQKLPTYNAADVPNIAEVFRRDAHLIAPIAALIIMLSLGYTPYYSALFAIIALAVVSLVRAHTRMSVMRILDAFEDGARKATPIAIAMGCAALIVSTTELTGVAYKFTAMILTFSDGSLFVALLLIALSTIILGMDLPVIVSFIIASLFGVPVLIELGVDRFTAHMFVFYYAILAAITPPICMGAYAAASIAGSNMFRTGLTAMQIGTAAYILPFMLVYEPNIMYQGDIGLTLFSVSTAAVGILALASGVQGYFLTESRIYERLALIAAALLAMAPDGQTDLAAFLLILVVVMLQARRVPGNKVRAFLGRD